MPKLLHFIFPIAENVVICDVQLICQVYCMNYGPYPLTFIEFDHFDVKYGDS